MSTRNYFARAEKKNIFTRYKHCPWPFSFEASLLGTVIRLACDSSTERGRSESTKTKSLCIGQRCGRDLMHCPGLDSLAGLSAEFIKRSSLFKHKTSLLSSWRAGRLLDLRHKPVPSDSPLMAPDLLLAPEAAGRTGPADSLGIPGLNKACCLKAFLENALPRRPAGSSFPRYYV